MRIKTAVILAAGMGTRLKELGQLQPKGFLKLGEKTIIEESEVIVNDLGPIYFNFDSTKIREDDSDELARIVDLMVNTYPEMTIKIESHTDSRGPSVYNDSLSSKRARSTYDYLVSRGINASRIIEFKGLGESQLTNGCDGTIRCTEAQHQRNRRTNFIIVNVK